jgi:hypothetical protein
MGIFGLKWSKKERKESVPEEWAELEAQRKELFELSIADKEA